MITQQHRPIAGRLRGAWTALVTPFAGDGLDLYTLRKMIEHQIASGVDGLLVCGSTGEVLSLTDDEYRQVLRTTVKCAGGRVPVMAATGAGTAATIARTRNAHELGADVALVAVPPGAASTQHGIVAQLEAIAAATPLPIVIATVPEGAGAELPPETVVRLSRVPGILGMMEASGDVERVGFIARHAAPDFAIFAGSDALTLPVMALGGGGVISVAGNLAPATISALTAAASRGDLVEARRIQLALVDLNRALGSETDPIPVKAAAALLGFGTGDVRLPLTGATTGTVETLNRALRTVEETARALRRSRPEMRPTI